MQTKALHDGEHMRLPQPKSAPGVLLYLITGAALILIGRVVWVLVGQNVETVSAEKGYDKLLSRHWTEIMNWLAENGFWLSLFTAAFLGGTLALWAYIALQAKEEPAFVGPVASQHGSKELQAGRSFAIEINRSARSAGYALGEGTPQAAELALPGITSTLLTLKKAFDIPIPALDAPRAKTNVRAAATYLVEVGALINGGHIEEAKKKAMELTGQPAPLARSYVPIPAPPPADEDGFNYSYLKAVLQAAVLKEKGDYLARAGEKPHAYYAAIMVRNEHGKPLRDCSVVLREWAKDGKTETFNELIRVGETGMFDLGPTEGAKVRIVTRDMTDKVSNPPFLLPLQTRYVPLDELSCYVLTIELRSRYPYPTIVVLQVDTGIDLAAGLRRLDQYVSPLSLQDIEAGKQR